MCIRKVLALLLSFAGAEAFADGILLFNNLYPLDTGLLERGWRIRTYISQYQLDGPASGSTHLAQLLAGKSSDSLVPIGPPVSFRTGAGAGYFDPASDPTGLVRVVPAIDDVNGGSTYVEPVPPCAGPRRC